MQNGKTIFFIGLIVFFIPILGFPGGFEAFLQIVGGFILMVLAGRKTIEKRIIKDRKPRKRKEKNPVFVESAYKKEVPLSTTMNEASEPNEREEA